MCIQIDKATDSIVDLCEEAKPRKKKKEREKRDYLCCDKKITTVRVKYNRIKR